MRSLLVLLSLSLLGLSHRLPLRHDFGQSLSEGCRFALGYHEFDLCPIISRPVQAERLDPDSPGRVMYHFNLDDPTRNHTLLTDADGSQCPAGTWICMITINPRTPGHPRVLHYLPIASVPSLGTETKNYAVAGTHQRPDIPLDLHLHDRQAQQALIQFYCDDNATEPSSPSFSGKINNIHSFIWKSRYACATPRQSVNVADDTNDGSEPSEDDKDEEQQDMVDPAFNSPRSPRIIVILLLPGAALVMLGIAIYSPPAVLRQWFDKLLKPTRFGVGEIDLVEWAQEEHGVIGNEEDIMVNASEDIEQAGEYIPLKPSPRRNILAHYGSTRHDDRLRFS